MSLYDMDTMCNKSESDLSKKISSSDEPIINVEDRSESPVFRCSNHPKPIRITRSDSSDYDIPSYQVNQSCKSRTSSKNETGDLLLPFTPIISPIPVSTAQFQPPSIHSLGTIAKRMSLEIPKGGLCDGSKETKACSVFESLGMTDKDISWVSSMASPPPDQIPRTEFNTLEKATFFPEEKFQNIQPRALFSPTFDDDFGCKPLTFTSESEDDESYQTNIRLSDVCATLKQLEVKSVDSSQNLSDNSKSLEQKNVSQETAVSPVIKANKSKEKTPNSRKKEIVLRSSASDDYKFSVVESEKLERKSSGSIQNFIEDDSFQSLSFSGIDELCKTLINVTDQSDSKSFSVDCDKTLNSNNVQNPKSSETNLRCAISKHFYTNKANSDVYSVSSMDNLHSYAKALDEGDVLTLEGKKVEKSLTEKGIVRFDILCSDSKIDSTKRLHSQLSESKNNNSSDKKFKQENDENRVWQEAKIYLSECPFNVSNSEVFKTLDNQKTKELEEKTKKDCDSEKNYLFISEEETTMLLNSEDFREFQNNEMTLEKNEKSSSEETKNPFDLTTNENVQPLPEVKLEDVQFSTVFGQKIEISNNALEKAKKLLSDCDESWSEIVKAKNCNIKTCSKKIIKVSPEALEKAKNLLSGNETRKVETSGRKLGCGLLKSRLRKRIEVSGTALEKAKALMSQCNGELDETHNTHSRVSPSNKTKIQVSLDSLEKAKLLLSNDKSPEQSGLSQSRRSSCEKSKIIKVSPEALEKAKSLMSDETSFAVGFSTCSGKAIQISNSSVEKAKALMAECYESKTENFENVGNVRTIRRKTELGKRIEVSNKALEKAKAFMSDCVDTSSSTKELVLENNDFAELERNIEETKTESAGKSDKILMMGFTTGSKKKIQISNEALEKAKALFSDCDKVQNTERNALDTSEISTELEKEKSITLESNTFSTEYPIKSCGDSGGVWMGGFATGSGMKIKVSKKALEKAKALMSKCDELLDTENNPVGNEVLNKNLEKEQEFVLWDEKFPLQSQKKGFENVENISMKGFATGSGKKIEVSIKALEKAKALMSTCDEILDEKKNLIENEDLQAEFIDGDEEFQLKNSKGLAEGTWMKGFATGSGKRIEVSNDALEKAKALMSKCDRTSDETENSRLHSKISTGLGKAISVSNEVSEKAKPFLSNSNQNFDETLLSKPKENSFFAKTADDNKRIKTDFEFPTSSNNQLEVPSLEKAKAVEFTTEVDVSNISRQCFAFSTAAGTAINVSEEALKKAKEREISLAHENFESSDNTEINKNKHQIDKKESSIKLSTSPKEDELILKPSELTEGDWEEIIPSWFHSATTEDRQHIVKSPVLTSNNSLQKKVKRRKLQFEDNKKGFVVPYKDNETKTSVKRSVSDLSVEKNPAPLKKIKSLGFEVCFNLNEKRKQGRVEQEKLIKDKQKVKPVVGSHLKKKCQEKQMTWMEAVKGAFPKIYSRNALKSYGVRDDVIDITISNAGSFKFMETCFGSGGAVRYLVGDECLLIPDDEGKIGVEDFKSAFLSSPGVQPNLIPDGWLENHYKWIVWKLAHYEKSFPNYFGGKSLSPNNVLLQLKYRYDREIDRSERSALKKILERDDTSAKRIVLCVCGIKKIISGEITDYELSLTDGWYSCPARVDPALAKVISKGKLSVGTKLVTQGAVLVNCEQGVSPLENKGDVYLKISANSTRRIRWDVKLGFQKNPENITIPLGSILPQGGIISRLDVIIVRVYPMLYMEKMSNGHHKTRNRRLEERADAEYRKIQEQRLEAIRNEVHVEMQKKILGKKGDTRKFNRNSLPDIEQGEELCRLMETSSDPSALEELMSINQKQLLQNFHQNETDRLSRELSEKIEQKLKKEKLNKRNVSEFLRVKIVDLRKPDYNNPAVLSVWNPNEEIILLFSEGKAVSLMNVSVGNSSKAYKPMQINTTRQTNYRQINRSIKYPSRQVTHFEDVSSKVCPVFEEVDIVGFVMRIQDVSYGSRMSQIVYLTDMEFRFVGIVFWGSCKDYGWENILTLRSIVACSNLQWKKNFCLQEVPSLHVNENSVFTENPKHQHLKEEINKLKKKIPQDINEFVTRCDEELTTKLMESKWRTNLSKNSSMNDSSPNIGAERRKFESKPAASSTPIKPFSAGLVTDEAEPSPIQRRIEKLQSYGEPPPLIPLIIRNNVRKSFKKKNC